ncbi:cell division protein FtsL [Kordiimonas pumila]|uniref:Cell division protein FtsL n=1 Tax=Kordiimonas pumila TaxID=2161677 RepID=A0ABV7D740_9PROT|nr:hypothetical protein [Kordiimonas pumila]
MRKYVTTFAAITAIASGVAVLQLKATVQNKTDEIRALVNGIHDDKEAIRVLEAEWAYQSSPHTLQENSIRFLALMPPKANQILSTASVIPLRPEGIKVDSEDSVLLPASYSSDAEKNDRGDEKKTTKKPRQGVGL